MSNYDEWKNWDSSDFAKLEIKDKKYFEKITKDINLGENINVLEIGFGNGSFLKFLQNNNCKFTGIEIIPELLTRAAKVGYEVYSDIDELPTSIKYDLVVMFDVLEHIPQDDIPSFFNKLHKLLNKGASLIIRTPNGSSPFGLTNQYGDITHCTVVTGPKLDYWAQGSGLVLNYVGGNPYVINEGKLAKIPSRFIRRVLYLLIERLARWIFSPQSKGFLTSNLFAVLKKN